MVRLLNVNCLVSLASGIFLICNLTTKILVWRSKSLILLIACVDMVALSR